jgi:hypothetical protein
MPTPRQVVARTIATQPVVQPIVAIPYVPPPTQPRATLNVKPIPLFAPKRKTVAFTKKHFIAIAVLIGLYLYF